MTTTRLPDNKDMWRIAAPMILSNISVPLLGMVETGVTGHLEDPAYLGAVAIGATIFTFISSPSLPICPMFAQPRFTTYPG